MQRKRLLKGEYYHHHFNHLIAVSILGSLCRSPFFPIFWSHLRFLGVVIYQHKGTHQMWRLHTHTYIYISTYIHICDLHLYVCIHTDMYICISIYLDIPITLGKVVYCLNISANNVLNLPLNLVNCIESLCKLYCYFIRVIQWAMDQDSRTLQSSPISAT